LVPVIETTEEALFEKVKATLEEFNLKFKDCIGIGTDGASNMVGVRNSLWSRMSQANPDMVLMRCVYHSLALCIQKAF